MREKDKKCPAAVKIRLAPLPTRNLNFGNSLNLEECLNRSVALDGRPSSRMSDLSNFSGQSMISVARSNYEQQSDELRKSLNRNVILEALRMKDLRRRPVNYLNENADNYSVDLAFNNAATKRKRGAYDDDEESELDCLFNKTNKTKFARGNLHIPSKNRFVSSQYKNNEIASSYFSINNTSATARSNMMNKNKNQIKKLNYLNNPFDKLTSPLKRPAPQQSFNNLDSESKKLFKIPLITISNSSSSKENTNLSSNLSANNLSNASISPITKKTDDQSTNSSTASSLLFKSFNNSSNELTENNLLIDTQIAKAEEDQSLTELKDKKDVNYKIPEHFHSIDEHIRDENKARSRLGTFLKAIYNVTSPFISKTTTTAIESNKTIDNNSINTGIGSSTFPSITSTVTTSTAANNLMSSDSTFKIPTTTADSTKFNSTSTPLKVTFNLPSTDKSNEQNKSDLSSVFKFGHTSTTGQPAASKAATTSSSNNSSVFSFGKTDLNKPKETTIPLSTKSSLSNFTFNQTSTQQQQDSTSSKDKTATSFAINLPTTSSFNLNPTTTSSSMFTFGQQQQPIDKQQQDANKSSFFFKIWI